MSDVIKVLAVDDVEANLMIIRGCLKGGGFELVTCTNAVDALQKFKEQYFDILLLDVIMPGIDGFELRKLIRATDPERPIIFLTSMVEDKNMTMLNQITWDANTYYLNKAVGKKTLIQKITEVVTTYRQKLMAHKYSDQLEEERALAGELQKVLLPNWCICNDDVLFSSIYVPYMHVSGDLYEMIPFGDSKYLFFIGDISGHGISAALYMAAVQSWLKMTLRDNDIKIHELMTRLNKFFCEDLQSKNYMTALAAIVDFKNNHISLHSSGHPGMIFASPSKKTVTVSDTNKGSMPLGWMTDAEFPESENFDCDFDEDTIFIAMTDGVLDMTNEDGQTMDEEDFHSIIQCQLDNPNVVALPYRIKGMMAKMGVDKAPDDFTIVAFQKRSARKGFLERVIPATLPEVDKLAREFSAITDDVRQSTEIDLCVHEYLNNVVIHGNHDKKKAPDLIYASIGMENGDLVLQGAERGGKWDITGTRETNDPQLFTQENPEEKKPEEEENLFATSGRGIQIIKAITQYVSYETNCGLNETKFVFNKRTSES